MRLLLVEDNEVDREAVRRLLGDAFSFVEASSIAEARALADEHRPDCVLVDYRLPDGTGLDLLPDLKRLAIPVVMLTGQGDETTAVAAVRSGAADYLVKERLDAGLLQKSVEYAIETARLGAEVERQAAEIREREAMLTKFLDALPIGVWVLDREGEPLLANRCADDVLGPPPNMLAKPGPATGRQFLVANTEEPYPRDRLPFVRALAGESCQVDDLEYDRGGDKTRIAVTARPIRDDAGAVEYSIGAFRDITREVRLEEQYRHSQKMEAIGRTAGGVAHDFNNVLTIIYTFGGFVLQELDDDSPAREDMEEILKAASKAEALTRQLLAFSRTQQVRPTLVNLSELVAQIQRMIERVLGEDVELELGLDQKLWPVHVDPGMFEHVIVNLVVNARDAMPRGGKLRIHTRNDTVIPGGDFVELCVTDTGTGMNAKTRAKAFEPFFTTKGEAGGSGLGLATCYGIVKQAGGRLELDSALGRGTTVRLRLPRAQVRSEEKRDSSTRLRRVAATGGAEGIVLVEDDPQVRTAAARALRNAGYRVYVGTNGSEGLELCHRHRDDVRLVLSDVVMPEMSGRDFALAVLDAMPDVRILFMSGYNDRVIERYGALTAGTALLQKPFSASRLLEMVREQLDAEVAEKPDPIGKKVLILDRVGWASGLVLAPGREIIVTADPDEALHRATNRSHDAILWDVMMPGMKGLDYYELARRVCPEVEAAWVFITDVTDEQVLRTVRARTGRPIVATPTTSELLDAAVAATTRNRYGSRSS